ncbi:MAG: response regulator [Ruminococcaceae bacterium]|nr:response regulator [Oscillospiraceae bacterium]
MNSKTAAGKPALYKNVLISILVIAFFVAIILVYYNTQVAERRSGIIKDGKIAARQAETQLNDYLSTSIDTVKLAAYTLDNMLTEGATHEEIQAFMVAQSVAVKAAILENSTGLYGWIDGRFVSGTNWTPPADYVAVERPWYTKTIASNEDITVIDPYLDVQGGDIMLALTKKLCDGESVIGLDVSLSRVQEIVRNAVGENSIDMELILDNRGAVIAHSDEGEIGKNYSEEQGTLGAALLEHLYKSDGDYFEFDFGGTRYIAYQARMQNDWQCLSVMDATSAFGPLKLLLAGTIAVVALIVVVLSQILHNSSKNTMVAEKLNAQLSSTAEIYRSVHDLDLLHNTFSEIQTNESRITNAIGASRTSHENIQQTFNMVMDKLTDPSSKDEILRFIDFSTLNERMRDQKTITVEFLNTQNLWLRGRFIASERTADGRLSHVLWMVEDIDAEKRRRDRMFETITKMNEQISSVANIYFSMYDVDLANDGFCELRTDTQQSSGMAEDTMEHAQASIYAMMDQTTNEQSRDAIHAFVDLSTLAERMKNTNTVTEEFLNSKDIWCRTRFVVSKRDPDGTITHVLWLVESIDEEKRRRDALVEESQRAIAASEAKSSFLSNMSHEIRTPINAVLGMNEMILRESEDQNVLAYSESIKTAGNTLLGIVNDILDFSKIEAGKMEILPVDYDLSSVINDLVNMVQTRADDKGLLLKLDFDRNIPKLLHGDEVRIKQVVTNILTNAVKYTEKGSVTFAMGFERIPGDDDGIFLKVSVRDTGIGIKPEDMKKLFSEFERIEEKRNRNIEGTGLGMNITKRLMEMMGSSLKVESVYGEGSTFSFRLEQRVVKWEELGDYEESYRASLSQRKKSSAKFSAPSAVVLVVDDTPMNLMVFKSLLKRTGVQIDTAASGDEGLALAYDRKYDMIFLDHMMPEKDGIETLHELRAREKDPNRETPTVCLTANAISGAREKYLAEGFDDYLTKPIDSAKLEEMLIQYLPKEKLCEAQEEATAERVPETPSFAQGIDGLDAAAGMANCGSEDAFRGAMELFYRSAVSDADVIEGFWHGGDLKNYTVKVHALKSAARTIGASELSEKAKAMEAAGNAEDTALIDEKTPELLELYRAFAERLQAIFETGEDENLPPADEGTLREAYAAITECAAMMDYDMTESVLDSLKGYRLPPEDAKRVENIRDAMMELDWERVAALAGE